MNENDQKSVRLYGFIDRKIFVWHAKLRKPKLVALKLLECDFRIDLM